METDKTTLYDLSIFDPHEEYSVFHKLDFTTTSGGRHKFRGIFSRPFASIKEITGTQDIVKLFLHVNDKWPEAITNGTLLMVHKYYEQSIDKLPARPTLASAYAYKIFHSHDFSLVKYSVSHCIDLVKGMQKIIELLAAEATPPALKGLLDKSRTIINKPQIAAMHKAEAAEDLAMPEMLGLAGYLRYHYKQQLLDLMDCYHQLDAWRSMAVATRTYNLSFPKFIDGEEAFLNAEGLYHILLPQPVSYDVSLTRDNNFIFLTGANMAGKSTFIKSVGAAVFLAHIGMAVPANSMELTMFNGLLSNINVADNISKGESYFYNEVQRIKNTIIKVNNGKKWLVLIDELFKGTNVEDAMKCSTTVIKGLVKITNSLFILSTHLYEIGEKLKDDPNILFKYFETEVSGEQLLFTYLLKEGISNDRLGYLILKREGVVDMLNNLKA